MVNTIFWGLERHSGPSIGWGSGSFWVLGVGGGVGGDGGGGEVERRRGGEAERLGWLACKEAVYHTLTSSSHTELARSLAHTHTSYSGPP